MLCTVNAWRICENAFLKCPVCRNICNVSECYLNYGLCEAIQLLEQVNTSNVRAPQLKSLIEILEQNLEDLRLAINHYKDSKHSVYTYRVSSLLALLTPAQRVAHFEQAIQQAYEHLSIDVKAKHLE